eukprot:7098309-Pyramimonas_sp.AAC.2
MPRGGRLPRYGAGNGHLPSHQAVPACVGEPRPGDGDVCHNGQGDAHQHGASHLLEPGWARQRPRAGSRATTRGGRLYPCGREPHSHWRCSANPWCAHPQPL